MNLQLFADDETGAEMGVADQVTTEQQATETTEAAETVTPDKDPSKAFAARLGHERKKIEAEYAPYKSVIEHHAKASGLSATEYLSLLQQNQEREALEAEADRTGKTPEQVKVEKEKAEVESRLARFETKERLTSEEKTLISDPKIGKFVTDNLAKIREIAESTNTNLRTGLAIIAAEKLPELIDLADTEKQKETIIKDYLDSLKKGGKPIEIGGGASAPSATTPKTFDDARKAALEMLRNQK